jgi:RNA polymerase sigma factor (sigma-70 family)
MVEENWLAERFEEHRGRLRAMAYRMLGSVNGADDAVQETWLRLSRSDADAIENFGGWLTTVTARVCLSMLRYRNTRREESFDVHVPDPVVHREDMTDPEQEALLADSVGLALLVVLDTLSPAERLAFVLHDMFAVPFEDIASIAGRTTEATRQLASRARRRVQRIAKVPDADPVRRRHAVEAFLTAARSGDFDALVAVLDPDVVLRADAGAGRPGTALVRGAVAVASNAVRFSALAPLAQPVLVNGAPGFVVVRDGAPVTVMAFTVVDGKIAEIDVIGDRERLDRLNIDMASD